MDPLDVELAMKSKEIALQREISKGNFQGLSQNNETAKKKLEAENSTSYLESNKSKKVKKKEVYIFLVFKCFTYYSLRLLINNFIIIYFYIYYCYNFLL